MRLLPRSFALRTALAIGGTVMVLSLLGAGWAWLRAEAALRQQLDAVIAAEAQALVRDYQTLGPEALLQAAAVAERRTDLLMVLVQTTDGRVLAGRLPGVQAGLSGFATLRPAWGESVRALGVVFASGLNLVVGTPLTSTERAEQALAWTPVLVAVGVGLLAVLLGFVGARALERRLAAVSDAAGLVVAGDLSRRLPQSGRGDEFDRLIATVNTMLARLETLVATQRQVTDDIAHDLRSPLQRLRQRLEQGMAEARDPVPLEAAISELDAVLETFAALLRIARAEADVGGADVDLSALVTAVAEAFAPAAEEGGRAFVIEVAAGLHMPGDPALLQRMLANLLDNALMHGAGPLRVSLSPGPVLVVSDEGPGVPEADREGVLRRFVRLDRSRSLPGAGLGLALVAAAVRGHHGRIRLEATRADGSGLSVRVEFGPAAVSARSRPPGPPAA